MRFLILGAVSARYMGSAQRPTPAPKPMTNLQATRCQLGAMTGFKTQAYLAMARLATLLETEKMPLPTAMSIGFVRSAPLLPTLSIIRLAHRLPRSPPSVQNEVMTPTNASDIGTTGKVA